MALEKIINLLKIIQNQRESEPKSHRTDTENWNVSVNQIDRTEHWNLQLSGKEDLIAAKQLVQLKIDELVKIRDIYSLKLDMIESDRLKLCRKQTAIDGKQETPPVSVGHWENWDHDGTNMWYSQNKQHHLIIHGDQWIKHDDQPFHYSP